MGMYGRILIYPRVETPAPPSPFARMFRKPAPVIQWAYPFAEAPDAVGLAAIRAMERTELLVPGSADRAAGSVKPLRDPYDVRNDTTLGASWIEYELPASALHARMDRLVVTLTQAQTDGDLDDPDGTRDPQDVGPPVYPWVTVRVGRSLLRLDPDFHFRAVDFACTHESQGEPIAASTFAIVELNHELKLNYAIHRLKDAGHPVFAELDRVFALPVECCIEFG